MPARRTFPDIKMLPPIQTPNDPTTTITDMAHAITPLFEPAPPLASALHRRRPFSSYKSLIDVAEAIISNELSHADKLIVIAAHPRIGAPKQSLSKFSLIEQGYSATSTSSSQQQQQQQQQPPPSDPALEAVNTRLALLNDKYEAIYGFPFVIFVNGRPRTEIADILANIVDKAAESSANGGGVTEDDKRRELDRGLKDMLLIARDRLAKMEAGKL